MGWADEKWNQTVLSEKSYLEYQDELCPSLIEEKLEGSVLKIANHNEKPPALKDHLGCFLSHETLSGVHVDAAMDFSHGLKIDRDAYGHPLQLSTLGAGGRILQTIGYRDDFKIGSIQIPGKGKTTF